MLTNETLQCYQFIKSKIIERLLKTQNDFNTAKFGCNKEMKINKKHILQGEEKPHTWYVYICIPLRHLLTTCKLIKMIRWRTASVCKHTHPCTHTHKGPCDLHNRLVSLASGGVWSASVFPTLPPLSCRRSGGPDNGGKAELFIKEGGPQLSARDQPRAGQNINGRHHVLFIKATHAAAAGNLVPASPLANPPEPDRQGHDGPFLPGPGTHAVWKIALCLSVKAKERRQETLTSTSFAFYEDFRFKLILIYKGM